MVCDQRALVLICYIYRHTIKNLVSFLDDGYWSSLGTQWTQQPKAVVLQHKGRYLCIYIVGIMRTKEIVEPHSVMGTGEIKGPHNNFSNFFYKGERCTCKGEK